MDVILLCLPVSLSLVASARICLASSRVQYKRMMRASVFASCDKPEALLSTKVLTTVNLNKNDCECRGVLNISAFGTFFVYCRVTIMFEVGNRYE